MGTAADVPASPTNTKDEMAVDMAPPDATPGGKIGKPKANTPLHARRASFSKALHSMPSLPSHARARPVPRAPPITERVQARDPASEARALLSAPPGHFLAVDVTDPVSRTQLLATDLRRGARIADEQLVAVRQKLKTAMDGIRQLTQIASSLHALKELAETESVALDAEAALFIATRRALELAVCIEIAQPGCLCQP